MTPSVFAKMGIQPGNLSVMDFSSPLDHQNYTAEHNIQQEKKEENPLCSTLVRTAQAERWRQFCFCNHC